LPSWSADGRYILFQRFPVFESEAAAGIWLLDIESGEQVEIAAIGRLPVWGSD
jgi:Tol biopolymer transport system component